MGHRFGARAAASAICVRDVARIASLTATARRGDRRLLLS